MVEAPRQPKPPASETAAARRWYETPPMPASITGCSISSRSVRRVRMGAHRIGARGEARHLPGGTREVTGLDQVSSRRATDVARLLGSGYGRRVSALCRRSECRGSVVCRREGAIAVEEVAVPSAWCEHHGSGLVLEEPAGEVAPRPIRGARDADGAASAAATREDLAERDRHVVIGDELTVHGSLVTRRRRWRSRRFPSRGSPPRRARR